MLVYFGWEGVRAEWERSVVCIGTFDGVHLGHQALLGRAVDQGRELEIPSLVLTFDRHPLEVLAPERAPARVSGLDQMLQVMGRSGICGVVVLPFTEALSRMVAQEFLDVILRGGLRAERLIVGHDFAFGKGREGTAEWLGGKIETTVVGAVEVEGERVSSSRIRELVLAGDVAGARLRLGRPFAYEGVVVGGQKLGRQLGYPTVNLVGGCGQVVPGDGVYAGWAETVYGRFSAAISVGMRPTVEGAGRSMEAYLLDYPGTSLYGTVVELEFWEFLRGEVKFDGLEALKDQMGKDVETVARLGMA